MYSLDNWMLFLTISARIQSKCPNACALTRHVQEVLKKPSLSEDVIVTFDMDALSFSYNNTPL